MNQIKWENRLWKDNNVVCVYVTIYFSLSPDWGLSQEEDPESTGANRTDQDAHPGG